MGVHSLHTQKRNQFSEIDWSGKGAACWEMKQHKEMSRAYIAFETTATLL